MFEPLERRRLFTHDLFISNPDLDGGIIPGVTAQLTLPIYNNGPLQVTQSFFVEGKLVHTDSMIGPVNADFSDPNAISIFKTQVDQDILVYPAGYIFAQSIVWPQQLASGRWSFVVAVDSTQVVLESNDSNNTFAFGPVRVIGEDKNILVDGTGANDYIAVTQTGISTGVRYSVSLNGSSPEVFTPSEASRFTIRGLAGNDTIVISNSVPNVYADGGEGNDKIVGGSLADFLVGGAGKDQLDGGLGNDRLNGNGGNDKLFGGFGADRLYGYAGNDYLDGGSSGDRLDGGAGLDTLYGQSGVDRFFTTDGEVDSLFGASGRDVAECDPNDVISSVEVQL